jgi:hypothetical protein
MLPFRLDVLRRLHFKNMFIDLSRHLGGFCQNASWGCARSIATLSLLRGSTRIANCPGHARLFHLWSLMPLPN